MKIVHITTLRNLNAGQRKQLESEISAVKQVPGLKWKTIAIHDSEPQNSWEYQVPKVFRKIFLRYLFAWYIIYKSSKESDCVLVRHMPFDIFGVVISPFVRNRITIHHACEPAELKIVKSNWRGRVASLVETFTGCFAICSAKAVAGVTREISVYEANRCVQRKKYFDFPNGINVGNFDILPDDRNPFSVEGAFICGEFSDWHGLDIFFDAVDGMDKPNFKIHLIGKLLPHQKERLSNCKKLRETFPAYGVLSTEEYFPILAKCDFGIGSFGLFRKGHQEASTLKVREYLAMGLPVFSGHRDTAFPENFPYYIHCKNLDLQSMIEFGIITKSISRGDIREKSSEFISKEIIILKAIASIRAFD